MKVMHVVGARPNFMKIAPIMREMAQFPLEFEQTLVHTGQHYDANMSQVFFDELELPQPDINLEAGGGSHAGQTAHVMLRFEPVLLDYKPDWILVPGDVNSTLACALVASKLDIRIAHVEAGLRSFDRTMPEEINRILTDQISDLLLTPSLDGNENLQREGISPEKIHFVGNVMIDTLVRLLPKAEQHWPKLQEQFCLDRYMLVTLHRPSNVDQPETLQELMLTLHSLAEIASVIFPVHPRTHRRITELHLNELSPSVQLVPPLGYLDFLALEAHAHLVVTDSGGIQEETTFLGIPCLTVRENTERPVTITHGTNRLVPNRQDAIVEIARRILTAAPPQTQTVQRPLLWDGHTAQRIVRVLRKGDACDKC